MWGSFKFISFVAICLTPSDLIAHGDLLSVSLTGAAAADNGKEPPENQEIDHPEEEIEEPEKPHEWIETHAT
jgi:hypothetical protein